MTRAVTLNSTVVTVNTDTPVKAYDRMIFGGFLEHFDNQIYGGVFDPGSPLADERGFRLDVIDALKELRVPVIRWPGGCAIRLKDRSISGRFEAVLLAGDSPDAFNSPECPERVVPKHVVVDTDGSVDLPPHSLMILEIPTANSR